MGMSGFFDRAIDLVTIDDNAENNSHTFRPTLDMSCGKGQSLPGRLNVVY